MTTETDSFWALERANRRRVARLVASQVLVFAALGLGFDLAMGAVRFAAGRPTGFPWCTAAGLIFGIVQSMRTYYGGPGMVLGAVGAFPVEGDEPEDKVVQVDKVLIDVTREMALAARLPAPRLYMIDDPAPNSFAVGRNFGDSVICVTRGLVDMMDREELQSVIAHEMAHIRSYDMRLTMLVTVTMLGNLGSLAQNLFATVMRGTTALLSREREYLADAAAVEFTRNPNGMIRALEKIRDTQAPLKRASRATAPLFLVDPCASAGGVDEGLVGELTRIRSQMGKSAEQLDAEAEAVEAEFAEEQYRRDRTGEQPVSTHPPLPERIARLRRLSDAPAAAAYSPIFQR
jgi:heat shock protein HtpX